MSDARFASQLGRLREAIVSVQSLEQLAPSLYAGPATILQLVDDVRQSLEQYARNAADLCHGLEQEELAVSSIRLQDAALRASEACVQMLAPLKSPLKAKARLSLEKELPTFSRPLRALLENFEFLVMSLNARPIALDFKELLCSGAQAHSGVVQRPVPVAGPGLKQMVSLPVQAVLRGLSIWYCSLQKEGVGLWVEPEQTSLVIRFSQLQDTETIAYFFNHTPCAVSLKTAELGLAHVGVECFEQGHSIRLPWLAD